MRFGHTSTLSLFSLGVGFALAWGCGGIKESTFNPPGSGTGSNTGTGTSSASGVGVGTGSSSSAGTGTGTSSTATVVVQTTTSGTSGAGGSGGLDPDAACGAVMQGTKSIPSDIFIMQDKSGSMDCPAADDTCGNQVPNPVVHPTRWEATTMALSTFVTSMQATGIGVGLGFFSVGGNNNAMCNVMSYATPVVPIAALPANSMAFTAAVGMTMPGGGTPTTPALQGAIEYARTYTMAQNGVRTASVVFVTDGLPSGCNSNVQNAAAAAMAGFTGTPSIKTYVIGMGAVATLDEIALAGSGGMTHYIPTAGDVVTTLTNALTSISGMVTCDYTIPAGSNPLLVNLEVTLGGGMAQRVGKVDNLAACGALGGWYYDVNPPATPTHITLCPQSCMPLQMTKDSSVQLLLGCPSIPPA